MHPPTKVSGSAPDPWYRIQKRCIGTGTHRNGVPVQDKAAGTMFRLASYAIYFVCKIIYCVTLRVFSCFYIISMFLACAFSLLRYVTFMYFGIMAEGLS